MIVMILLGIGATTWIAGIVEEAETKDVYKGEFIRMIGIAIMFIAVAIAVVIDSLK